MNAPLNGDSECIAVMPSLCTGSIYRIIDDYKHHLFFAAIIFSMFFILSWNADIFVQSLKYLEGLNQTERLCMFITMFIFISQPISWGYIVLNVGAGFLYGFFGGVCVVCLSSSIGISVVHFCSRMCFKQCLVKAISKLPQKMLSMMDLLKGKHAFKLVFLSRLTPLPFGLMNALFAVSGVRSPDYLIGSFLGLLPTQAINSYIGTTLRSIEEVASSRKKSHYTILILQIVICCLVSSFVVRLANQNLDNELIQVSTSTNALHIKNLPKSSKKSSVDNNSSSSSGVNGSGDGDQTSQGVGGESSGGHLGVKALLSPRSSTSFVVPIDAISSSNA